MASYCVLMLQKILIDKRYLMKNVILFKNPFKFYLTFTATQKHFIVGLQVVFIVIVLLSNLIRGIKKPFVCNYCIISGLWVASLIFVGFIHVFVNVSEPLPDFSPPKKKKTQWWIFHDSIHNFHYIFHCMTDTDKCFHFVYQCCLPDHGHKVKGYITLTLDLEHHYRFYSETVV